MGSLVENFGGYCLAMILFLGKYVGQYGRFV